jgi:hypothetical protein
VSFLTLLISAISASIYDWSFLISSSIYCSSSVLIGFLSIPTALDDVFKGVAVAFRPDFSARLMIFPLYVLIRISFLFGLVIKPASIPDIDSEILVSNLIIGMGDLCSYEYISILPSSLPTMNE